MGNIKLQEVKNYTNGMPLCARTNRGLLANGQNLILYILSLPSSRGGIGSPEINQKYCND